MSFELPNKATIENLEKFAHYIIEIQNRIGFKVSSRGWCYQLESERLINKDQFDKVEKLINDCRKKGIIPIDFTAEEEGRKFSGVVTPNENTPQEEMREWIEYLLITETFGFQPNWWEGEKYYIQMLVEKIDLKTLFKPICEIYKIPIATSKGWSSMLQRAEYARRFKEAEENGLKPVLLYCGDHDPDGLRISDFIRKNLEDLIEITWEDGLEGYDPQDLIIDRFGLDYDFIIQNNFTWINNLITGSGKNLGSPSHKNYHMEYVQDYIKKYGVRKCEANAIVPKPQIAKQLVNNAITKYLGENAQQRFKEKLNEVKATINDFRERIGLNKSLQAALDAIDNEGE